MKIKTIVRVLSIWDSLTATVQATARELLTIIADRKATRQERRHAGSTLKELMFPTPSKELTP